MGVWPRHDTMYIQIHGMMYSRSSHSVHYVNDVIIIIVKTMILLCMANSTFTMVLLFDVCLSPIGTLVVSSNRHKLVHTLLIPCYHLLAPSELSVI